MPTSDERRDVAAMLRESWPEAGGMEEVWEVLDPILGTHDGPDVYKAWEQTFNRLADLIDPTCGEWRDAPHPIDPAGFTEDDSELWCEHCDIPLNPDYRYCPYCGSRVVSDDSE